MIKRMTAAMLSLVMLCGVLPMAVSADTDDSLFYETEHVIDDINGSRDTDEMVLYDALYGDMTGTNAYGYEVTVSDGVVVAVGGNNVAIPNDGFVLSGHGDAKDWLYDNIVVGMRVETDEDRQTVRFVYDADSVKASVETAIDNMTQTATQAKAAYVYADHDAAAASLAEAQSRYEAAVAAFDADGDEEAFVDECAAIVDDLTAAQNALCESYTVQYRGVWIRPTQLSASAVEDYVRQLKLQGINTVSIEGFFENSVIMEVPEDCLFEKNERFRFDMLQAYIDACHKYDMECHLWMPIMCVGYAYERGYEATVAVKKPEWLSLSQLGAPDNENGFMMIDPANTEARAYLVDFYEYIVTNYDIDCFELDYIRYYTSSADQDFGYTQAAFDGFEQAYGHGVTPTYDRDAAYWDDWCEYRRDCITAMVREVRMMIDRVAPDVLLAADVNPTSSSARDNYYQDYPLWLEEGMLDILHQMAYGDGYGDAITDAVRRGTNRTMIVTGLGVYLDYLNAEDMERQAREDNTYGNYGDFYFEAQTYLRDKVYTTASQSVYREWALAPFADPTASVKACLTYMQGRIDDVLVPLGGVTDDEAAALTACVTAANDSVSDGRIAKEVLEALRSSIAAVADANAKDALSDDLKRATWIATILDAPDYQPPMDAVQTPETGAPATTAASASEDGMSTTTILVIVIAVIVAIVGGAFGVWKLKLLKK